MPSHIPRTSTTRKKEQLLNCSEYLRLAIFHNKPESQIEKRAEKYRLANISLLKAKIHLLMEDREYPNEQSIKKTEHLEREISVWKQKELGEIITEFKSLKEIG